MLSICVLVLGALAVSLYALHKIRPTSFRFSAKLAKLASVEVEIRADVRDR